MGRAREDEFEQFVLARAQALWRTAWLLTGDGHAAEDLVQTALAKSWPRFGQVDAFEAYVRRVMLTTHLGWRRRRWNGEVPTEVLAEGGLEHTSEPDLLTALMALPRGQRAVVVLRHVEDLTERQTAELLGISIGTVKSQHARAIAALRLSPALAEEDS